MIAADTLSLVAFFQGERARDVEAIETALANNNLRVAPVVITELFSGTRSSPGFAATVGALPCLELLDGYWERAGQSRRLVLSQGLKARLADSLIAQACIDHKLPLIARDGDFRHFAKHCGLVLA
jgi:predicted nucleic acid-binding protein